MGLFQRAAEFFRSDMRSFFTDMVRVIRRDLQSAGKSIKQVIYKTCFIVYISLFLYTVTEMLQDSKQRITLTMTAAAATGIEWSESIVRISV